MGLSSMVSPNRPPQNPNYPPIYKPSSFPPTNLEDFLNNNNPTSDYAFNNLNNNSLSIYNHHQLINHQLATAGGGGCGGGGGEGGGNMVKKETSPSPSCLSSSSSSSPPAAPQSFNFPGFGQSSFQELLLRGFEADVVDPQMLGGVDPMVGSVHSAAMDWLQYPREKQVEMLGSQLHVGNRSLIRATAPVGHGSGMEVGFPESQLTVAGGALVGNSSGVERKRRVPDEVMDKTIERKQRRMIKNRESAARSRAKKQAYTNKLEEQVSQLRKEKKMLVNEKKLAALFPLESKPQLRRTTSSIF